jgi:hypothetical protein
VEARGFNACLLLHQRLQLAVHGADLKTTLDDVKWHRTKHEREEEEGKERGKRAKSGHLFFAVFQVNAGILGVKPERSSHGARGGLFFSIRAIAFIFRILFSTLALLVFLTTGDLQLF